MIASQVGGDQFSHLVISLNLCYRDLAGNVVTSQLNFV